MAESKGKPLVAESKGKPLVIVDWFDISGVGRWSDIEKVQEMKPLACRSVGWLCAETEGYVTIFATENDNKECVDSNTIPRGAIKHIRYLRK